MNLILTHEPGNEDGAWMAVCDRHGTCINTDTRAEAGTICELDFCEACVADAAGHAGVWAVEVVDGVRVSYCLSCTTTKPLTAFPTISGKPGVRDLRACRACR